MTRYTIRVGLAVTLLTLAGCDRDAVSPDVDALTHLQMVAPTGGSASVSVGSTVIITFSHAMMQGREMLAALHEGAVSGPSVAGEWTWSPDRSKLTFTPARPLKRATQYTLHLGGGMKDANGRVIDMGMHGHHMGGQWVTGGMMIGGGGMMAGASHMGAGWQHANGSYGMIFSFTTAE